MLVSTKKEATPRDLPYNKTCWITHLQRTLYGLVRYSNDNTETHRESHQSDGTPVVTLRGNYRFVMKPFVDEVLYPLSYQKQTKWAHGSAVLFGISVLESFLIVSRNLESKSPHWCATKNKKLNLYRRTTCNSYWRGHARKVIFDWKCPGVNGFFEPLSFKPRAISLSRGTDMEHAAISTTTEVLILSFVNFYSLRAFCILSSLLEPKHVSEDSQAGYNWWFLLEIILTTHQKPKPDYGRSTFADFFFRFYWQ